MPSKNLIIHEYQTHRTCSGLDPTQYFGGESLLDTRVCFGRDLFPIACGANGFIALSRATCFCSIARGLCGSGV